MGIIIFVYTLISVLIIYIGKLIYKKYNNKNYGIFIMLFSVFYSLWNFLYLLSFVSTYNDIILLYLSRLLYSLTIVGGFSINIFLFYFNNKDYYLSNRIKYLIYFIFTFFLGISFFTPLVINKMELNTLNGLYYEVFGILFYLFVFLYLVVFVISIIIYIIRRKITNTITKLRLKLLLIGFLFLYISLVLFLVILPYFGIYLFQFEINLFFIPMLILFWYSVCKYFYLNLKLGLSYILCFIFSVVLSLFLSYFIFLSLNYYINTRNNDLLFLWKQNGGFLFNLDTILYILINIFIFKFIYYYLSKLYLSNNNIRILENKIIKLKSEIPYISNFTDLNSFLKLKFNLIFKIKYVEVILISDENKFEELVKYFGKEKINNIFINDIVFIEENKNKFNKNKIGFEINPESYLILPLYNNKSILIGFFNIGQKPFGDTYYTEEIKLITDFVDYISGHLKYLRLYDRINDLNINLDKLVDKKTMEYNALVNKQKDFISFVSHEIKGPIGSSIFQVDCLIDDLDDGKINKGYMKKELELLNNQLIKIGDLTNKIFSIEKYDIGKVTLSKEKVNINDIISSELELMIKKNTNIEFIINLDDNIGYAKLDKVQMTQVITNLITNAIKFSITGNENPKIAVSTFIRGEKIYIYIEDNGKEFEYTNIASLFEKYSTGKGSSIGLGMGLYLCKKIVEMHNGEISAENSEELSGAKFTIILPK